MSRQSRFSAADLPVRPFLKWAGGKTIVSGQISAEIAVRLRGRYFEPFLGGGAIFFQLRPQRATLSDSNRELIETYCEVRDNLPKVIRELKVHASAHCKDHYYSVRESVPDSAASRAARMIYLNHTCFNGLWRVNSEGKFNVPMGSYRDPRILDEDRLWSASEALQGTRLVPGAFHSVIRSGPKGPEAGDVIYADPPYVPISRTARFTSYTALDFGEDSQRRLARALCRLARRGVGVVASNSDAPLVRELYPTRLFELKPTFVPRAINSVGSGRGKVKELLICSRV